VNKIGVNILLSHVKDYNRLLSRLRTLKPSAVVATVDGKNDIPRVTALRAARPDTLVIGRVYYEQDGAMHTKPQATGDNNYWVVSPENALNEWGELGRNGGVLYLANEPGTNPENILRLMDWTCQVIELAHQRGIRLCVMNLSVGTPRIEDGWGVYKRDTGEVTLDPVLRLLAQYREMMLGLHEYLPGDKRVGRLDYLYSRCRALNIQVPNICITEFGYDALDGADPKNGYKSRDISGQEYAKTLLGVYQAVYAPHPEIIGATVFCAGDNGSWRAFDTEQDSGFWDELIRDSQLLEPPKTPTPTKPLPIPPVETFPAEPPTAPGLELVYPFPPGTTKELAEAIARMFSKAYVREVKKAS